MYIKLNKYRYSMLADKMMSNSHPPSTNVVTCAVKISP